MEPGNHLRALSAVLSVVTVLAAAGRKQLGGIAGGQARALPQGNLQEGAEFRAVPWAVSQGLGCELGSG